MSELVTGLCAQPSIPTACLLETLTAKYPGRFSPSQLRTLQRRIARWKQEHLGPEYCAKVTCPSLSQDEIEAIAALKARDMPTAKIAMMFGITERTVTYHVRRRLRGVSDCRLDKSLALESLAPAIDQWIHAHASTKPPSSQMGINVQSLHTWLSSDHHYSGSYKSVCRFVRKRHPRLATHAHYVTSSEWMRAVLQNATSLDELRGDFEPSTNLPRLGEPGR